MPVFDSLEKITWSLLPKPLIYGDEMELLFGVKEFDSYPYKGWYWIFLPKKKKDDIGGL